MFSKPNRDFFSGVDLILDKALIVSENLSPTILGISKLLLIFFLTHPVIGQQVETYEFSEWHAQGKLSIVNREIVVVNQANNRFIQVSEKEGEGLIWLPLTDFENGIIEIEMRGKDVFQRSFIGIAFHAVNDSAFDAVYCRPFNFFAKDSVRKIHAVQYISHPVFTWKKLREEKNGLFEKEILSPPDPNSWFRLKLILDNKQVKVFINQSETPSLTVDKISSTTSGKIGIFVGSGSGGDFKTIDFRYSN